MPSFHCVTAVRIPPWYVTRGASPCILSISLAHHATTVPKSHAHFLLLANIKKQTNPRVTRHWKLAPVLYPGAVPNPQRNSEPS